MCAARLCPMTAETSATRPAGKNKKQRVKKKN
jgi:hypothetical protein